MIDFNKKRKNVGTRLSYGFLLIEDIYSEIFSHTDKTLRSLVKAIDSFVSPPSMKISILVEQSALIIESMSNLMPDHDADPAVI